MTFFDRLFTTKNKFFKCDPEAGIQYKNASDSSPRLDLAAEQVRVLVYRECERRGRKLLFDSESVEKVPLENMCRLRRPSDIVVTNSAHAYRYKKPSSDVSALGEMVFGSVAISFKSGSICKIHNIPSPRRLLYTTIVPTSTRCSKGSRRVSDCEAASPSTDSKTSGCSSDSKLYNCSNKTGSLSSNNTAQCLLSPFAESKWSKGTNTGLHKSTNSSSLHALCTDVPDGCEDRLTSLCSLVAERLTVLQPSPRHRNLSESARCDTNAGPLNYSSFGSSQSLYGSYGSQCDSRSSSVSRNCSGGSLSSLRKRWNRSIGTSLDMSSCDEGEDTPVRARTKLGIALMINISEQQQTEQECFLMNHSQSLERILNRLIWQVEEAYARCDQFVHLTYTAFLATRTAVVDLVTTRQLAEPRWLYDASIRAQMECTIQRKPRTRKNMGIEKFVNDFCSIIRTFDVKDTNFFISTLLTAVLTHNLSWVSSIIANSMNMEERQNLTSEKTGCNPLCAQVGDLFGMVGSPLKCTKVIICGTDKDKDRLTTIVNTLSYFLRCNNVVEKMYEANFMEVMTANEKDSEDNFDSGVDCEVKEAIMAEVIEEPTVKRCFDSMLKSSCMERREAVVITNNKTEPLYPSLTGLLDLKEVLRTENENNLNSFSTSVAGKPFVPHQSSVCVPEIISESCTKTGGNFVAMLQQTEASRDCCNSLKTQCSKMESSLYPSIDELAKMENVRLEDLASVRDKTVYVHEFLSSAEKSPSPDEGYATLHAGSALEKEKNVMFVVGDSDSKDRMVISNSSKINVETENDSALGCSGQHHEDSPSSHIPVIAGISMLQQRCRTMERISQECEPHPNESAAIHLEQEKSSRSVLDEFKLVSLPICHSNVKSKLLPSCCLLGEVSSEFSPYLALQGVMQSAEDLEDEVRKDLSQTMTAKTSELKISEAVCIVGDLRTWMVNLYSTRKTSFGPQRSVSVASSQMVADMLESFLLMCRIGISKESCLQHLESKLQEIYLKSQAVAELLMTTDFCNLELLTSCLDLAVNDVPLLLSVATTHTPELAERYGVTFS